jgi:hypothetical protein
MSTPSKPFLEGITLVFRNVITYELQDGKRPALSSCQEVSKILERLSEFFPDQPDLFKEVKLMLCRWEDHFVFDRKYILAGVVAIKFQPENSMELVCRDQHCATVLFEYLLPAA